MSFHSQPIRISDQAHGAVLTVRLSTNNGRFQLQSATVKIRGNQTRTLTLTGSQAAISQALSRLSLLLESSHSSAKVTIFASDGHTSQTKTVKIAS